jgi:hypothetical protein
MSLNANGTISGTPTTGGRHDFSVTVTDSAVERGVARVHDYGESHRHYIHIAVA